MVDASGHPGDHPVNHPGTGDPMAHPGGRPGEKPGEKIWTPRLIAWEMTRSCNLDCVHCQGRRALRPVP